MRQDITIETHNTSEDPHRMKCQAGPEIPTLTYATKQFLNRWKFW